MTFSIRRALGVAVVAAAAGVAELTAQGSPPPQVTVGGVVYTQYVYQLKDSVNHFNNFDITRAYVNVLGKFSGGVGTRVTADIYRNADGSLGYRLKYAFATYTPQGSPLTFKIGQIHTPWIDWEEALWDYRMQGQMAMERAGYLSASDFGVGVDGKWGPDKVNFQFTVVNGEFYRSPEVGQGKDALARISVRVLDTDDSSRVGGLRVTGYAGYGRAANGDRLAVLLDGPQAQALSTLPFAQGLAPLSTSVPVPVAVIATVGKRLDEREWKALQAALLSLGTDATAREALDGVRMSAFVALDRAALSKARAAYERAR